MKQKIDQILHEIGTVLAKVNDSEVISMIAQIQKADKIVVCGAGRVGMAIRGFGTARSETATSGAAAREPVSRQHLLTLDDHLSVYPDMRDPIRIVLRSRLFAPRGCDDRARVVRGTSRLSSSVSAAGRNFIMMHFSSFLPVFTSSSALSLMSSFSMSF